MSNPSQMVSVRFAEEEILEIERRVGFDGMRNRSDVIRRSVHKLLDETASGDSKKRTTIRVGKGVRQQLEILEELTGMDASSVAALGIGLFYEQQVKKIKTSLDDGISLLDEIKIRGSHEDHIE
jgi:Arc/MetJ-type ribon-helix-helix transcriptional regulator